MVNMEVDMVLIKVLAVAVCAAEENVAVSEPTGERLGEGEGWRTATAAAAGLLMTLV
jgi:hypothetical protein